MKNPNAFVTWITGMAATGLLWVGAKLGWHLSTTTAALVAGAVVTHAAAIMLWIGKHGVKGAIARVRAGLARVWNGTEQAAAPAPAPAVSSPPETVTGP